MAVSVFGDGGVGSAVMVWTVSVGLVSDVFEFGFVWNHHLVGARNWDSSINVIFQCENWIDENLRERIHTLIPCCVNSEGEGNESAIWTVIQGTKF